MSIWSDSKARLVLIANFLLVAGTGITFMAVPWLLIHQPNGESLFGYSNAILTLGIFLLMPFLGKWIDRNSRKTVLLSFFVFNALLNTMVIVAMLIGGKIESWHLLTVFCLGSLAHTVYYPAQFAFNQEVFAPEFYEQLSGAIEVQWQAGAMIAGALGTLLITRVPLWVILTLDTMTYLSALALMIQVPYQKRAREREASAWQLMREGIEYLRQRRRLAWVLGSAYLPFVCIMVASYLTPIFIKDVLRSGADVYAISEIVYAIGAALAGLTVPWFQSRVGLIVALFCTIAVFSVSFGAMPLFPFVFGVYINYILQGWGERRVKSGKKYYHAQIGPERFGWTRQFVLQCNGTVDAVHVPGRCHRFGHPWSADVDLSVAGCDIDHGIGGCYSLQTRTDLRPSTSGRPRSIDFGKQDVLRNPCVSVSKS
jgi:MFS family permease